MGCFEGGADECGAADGVVGGDAVEDVDGSWGVAELELDEGVAFGFVPGEHPATGRLRVGGGWCALGLVGSAVL